MAPPPPKLEEALRLKLAEAVGDDATSYINSFRRCGRCGKACDAAKCIVEHPAHLRRDRGATFSFSSYESLYACGVCGAEFKEVVDAKGYAGCFGVYPRRRVVSKLEIPEETENHEYFESHELTAPLEETVTKRTAFGTHWGLVYFFGEDPYVMRDLLKHQEDLDFYV